MKQILTILFLLSALAVAGQTSYFERDTLARDTEFRGKVQFAMLEAASNILANPADSVQFGFAGKILLNPSNGFFVDQFVYAVLTNPVINGNSSDSDITFTVNSQFAKLDLAYRRERGELEEGEQ
jgi:hypothetical protein